MTTPVTELTATAKSVSAPARPRLQGGTWVGVVAAVSALFYLGVFSAISEGQRYGVLVFLGWAGTTQIKASSLAMIVACSAVATYSLGGAANSRIPIRWVRAIITIVGCGIVFVGGTIALLFAVLFAVLTATTNYYPFTSPDGSNRVVITEKDFGNGDIAQHRWGPIYTVEAGYDTHDYYQTLAHGTFTTSWSPTGFTLTYQTDQDHKKTNTVTVAIKPSAAGE